MASTTVVSTPAQDVFNSITNGDFSTQEVDNKQFFNEIRPGTYSIKPESRLQIRDQDVDHDFIERQVNKNTPELLDEKVLIFFPNSVYDVDGRLFARGGDYKIVGGNHTAGIEIESGIFKSEAYVVNFDTQLGGKISEALDLGNLLNVVEKEKRGTKKGDVRQIIVQLMAENEEECGDAKLREDQVQRILDSYPFITRATIGQWTSYHDQVGGRRSPLKTWTSAELSEKWKHYGDQDQYQEYIVIEPREFASWKQTAVSTLVTEHLGDNNLREDGTTKKDNILFIFHCSTQKQVEDMEDTKVKMNIHYRKMEQRYNIKIKTEFLRSK